MSRQAANSMQRSGRELIGFTDVAGFAGIEDGEAVIKPLEVSVNQDMKGLPTKFSQRIHGERIEVYKTTLPAKATSQMSAVEKQFHEEQHPMGERLTPSSLSMPGKSYSQPDGEDYDGPAESLTPFKTLKNFVDNIAADARQTRNWTKLNLFLSGVGVTGFLLALVLIMRALGM